jgi:hypothetical protein
MYIAQHRRSLGLGTWATATLNRKQSAALGAVIGFLLGVLVFLTL